MSDWTDTRRCSSKRIQSMLSIVVIVFISAGCTGLPFANDDATPVRVAKEGASVAGAAKEATPTSAAKTAADAPPTGSPTATARSGARSVNESVNEVVAIALGDTISVNGPGASVDGNAVRITASGTYSISGTLKDGQIVVDTKDDRTVKLVLNGVDITCTSSAPIYVKRARATVISLADGTENQIADGNSYQIDDAVADEPNAAIFSKGNLTIEGGGSLTVDANYRHAIASKDEINITGGNIAVNAANDGIKGRDFIAIKGGNVTVNAKGDGIQSNNDVDPRMGYVSIEGGNIDVTAEKDGIQAETSVVISGGTTTVSTGGGSAGGSRSDSSEGASEDRDASDSSADKARGIKAGSDVRIEGGTIAVDSFDDAINSSGNITIEDGILVLASGDDGIHADFALTISGGEINVTKSYEAIEGAVIAINGGTIRLAASDDGLNVADGGDRSSSSGRPGRDSSGPSVDKHLSIESGYVVIDAAGDGLDVNGWARMAGGTVIVNGPVVDYNGALDYAREFTVAGGTLVAVGSTGMAQAPDATSTQHSLVVTLSSPQPGGTLVHIEAEDGTEILTFAPIREYQSVIYSSPELKKGVTYNVYVGGSSTGSVVDGVYSDGSYTPGVRTARPTVSSIVSGIGSVEGSLPNDRRR